ncbi:hypothetical protein J7T55_000712 [Diaporthe amygdali]|uniref:uncharacterized protein n=1 Tax=Phomopsis amygdali TaxID=1214568 RepID=UPI0022FDBD09|nr:uncharacterized protein J7T55_000712 [Diaporthe amygdali]KAJ0110279.1 hypothetical protein J7T55_000712 [Diaporthe amygdali]
MQLHALATLTLVATVIESVAAGKLMDSCSTFVFQGTTLTGICKNTAGTFVSSPINLNKCLGNQNGNLVASKNGNALDTCSACSVTNNSDAFKCNNCRDSSGNSHASSIDLSLAVSNNNGVLTCFGQTGP